MPDQHREDEEAGEQHTCRVSRVTCPRQVGCVTVRVPPDIDESLSSGDVAVAEGANTTLSCVTRGQPQYVARV